MRILRKIGAGIVSGRCALVSVLLCAACATDSPTRIDPNANASPDAILILDPIANPISHLIEDASTTTRPATDRISDTDPVAADAIADADASTGLIANTMADPIADANPDLPAKTDAISDSLVVSPPQPVANQTAILNAEPEGDYDWLTPENTDEGDGTDISGLAGIDTGVDAAPRRVRPAIDTAIDAAFAAATDALAEPTAISAKGRGRIQAGWAVPMEPGETLEFRLDPVVRRHETLWYDAGRGDGEVEQVRAFEWDLDGGALSLSSGGDFRLEVPKAAGNYKFRIRSSNQMRMGSRKLESEPPVEFSATLLVKAEFDRAGDGVLAGYPIGIYPNERGRGASAFVARNVDLYAPPKHFILVTPSIEDLRISENFVLGEFVYPPARGARNYIAVNPRLVNFLEEALEVFPAVLGGSPDRRPLQILSAFISPNQLQQLAAEGIKFAQFTRYQYGDAAAVIWDADGDGLLDDLNGDGELDISDARILADQFSALQRKLGKFGGVGASATTKIPGLPDTPYVDIDLRGISSRW